MAITRKYRFENGIQIEGEIIATQFTGSGSGLTGIPAGNLTGSFPAGVSFYLGTSQISLGRASGEQALTGITSISGSSLTLGSTSSHIYLGTGVTSNITDIDGNTLNIGTEKSTLINVGTGAVLNTTLNLDATNLNLGSSKATIVSIGNAPNTQTVNIGTGSGTTTINVGSSGDIINISGSISRIKATELEVTDKLVVLNAEGLAGSGFNSGLGIVENGSVSSYIKVDGSRSSWDLKTTTRSGVLRMTPSSSAYTTEVISPATSNITITLPNESCTLEKSGHTQPISSISDSTIVGQNLVKLSNPYDIRFIRINADNTITLLDASTFRSSIGSGTVTSVALSLPNIFSVSGSPIASSGTLSASLVAQSGSTFLASPAGSAGTPSFRAIVASDIPVLNQNTTGSSGSCTGNAATATYAVSSGSCSGNSATASYATSSGTASSCSGNSATASYATSAGNADTVDNIHSSYIIYGNGTGTLGTKTTVLGDFNAAGYSGFFDGNNVTGAPTAASWHHLIKSVHSGNASGNQYEMHIAGSFWDDDVYLRKVWPGEIRPWYKIIHSGNVGAQSVSYATNSGTSSVCSGNAATSTYATSAGSVAWGNVSGKPATYPPDAHTHTTINNDLGVVGNIVATGNVTAYGSVSDIRLKTNIKPIDNALELLTKINGVTFNFNSIANEIAGLPTDVEQVGVIAQELESILPQLVKPAPFDDNYKMVIYDRIVALLIQAVKELKTEVDNLK